LVKLSGVIQEMTGFITASSGAPVESDLVAAIVPMTSTPPDIKGIFDICLRGLEKNSVPFYIEVVSEIPKTVSLKNLGRVLKESFDPKASNVYKYMDYAGE